MRVLRDMKRELSDPLMCDFSGSDGATHEHLETCIILPEHFQCIAIRGEQPLKRVDGAHRTQDPVTDEIMQSKTQQLS